MKIQSGAAISNIKGKKIEEVKITYESDRLFHLWINDSLSYLTIEEVLDLRDEINKALQKLIN